VTRRRPLDRSRALGRELARLLALVAALALPWAARAHGDGDDHDDDHDEPAEMERLPSAGNIGDRYEVLVKYRPEALGTPMALRVFVADARTNEPVANARVELTLTGPRELKLTPAATATPGVYLATTTFESAGDFDAVAKVTRESDADLVTLGTFHAGLSVPRARFGRASKLLLAGAMVVGALGTALALVGAQIVRRRRGKAQP
jgi:hypothetical protein